MESKHPTVLSIAGSDSSAGAGIQADVKMCAAIGVHCATAITSITAQNTLGVQNVFTLAPEHIVAQAQSVLEDLNVKAIKIGMLGNADLVMAVAEILEAYPHIPVILDPVIISSSGKRLLSAEGQRLLAFELLPKAYLLTPNLDEAAALLGIKKAETPQALAQQASLLHKMGCPNILMKGGHSKQSIITDALFVKCKPYLFEHPRINSQNTHGTGCNLSSAIAAYIALGFDLYAATEKAIAKTCEAIARATKYKLGDGQGPLLPSADASKK